MSKVRAQEHLELRIAEKHLRTALKNVAKVQDRQQAEDVEEERRVMAPSLRRHETLLTPHINASTANESTDLEKEKTDTNDDKSDTGPPDPPDDSYVKTDEYVEDKSPAPEYSDAEMADIEEDSEVKQVAVQCSKPGKGTKGKKKKGEEMQTLINTMRKNPRPVGEIPKKLDLVLVTKVPPIPATKGKKARVIAAQTVSVAHPSNKSNSSISNWANGVQVANTNTTRLLTATVSSSSVTGFPVKSISSRTSNSESKPTYHYPIQPDGTKLDDKSDILATLVPDYMAQVSSKASSPQNVPFKRKIEDDSTNPGATPTSKKARKKLSPLPGGVDLDN